MDSYSSEINLRIECTSKPWFGPRKRAKKYLADRKLLLDPANALKILLNLLGNKSNNIQQLRFIDYVHKGKSTFRYTIVIIWTKSDVAVRQLIYDLAGEMVNKTGWYPLVQGHRLKSQLLPNYDCYTIKESMTSKLNLTPPMKSISSAVDSNGGCSIRVAFEKGSILLDSGLPGNLTADSADALCLVSHSHRDHSGGLMSLIKSNIPVLMSSGTVNMMLDTGVLNKQDIFNKACSIISLNKWITLAEGIEVIAFPVPHSPGSSGLILRDINTALLYTGDLVCSTQRHDFSDNIISLLSNADRINNFVMIDATMAGRPLGASHTHSSETFFKTTKGISDVIIFSSDIEQLLYAYLDLFHYSKNANIRNNTHYLITPRLLPVFRFIHSSFITKRLNELDPFILSQYGKSMSAWGESRWLYWLKSDSEIPINTNRDQRIWFLSEGDELLYRGNDIPSLITIGRVDCQKTVFNLKTEKIDFDSTPWTLHSDEEHLLQLIKKISTYSEVCLFHNFPKRIRKFIKQNQLKCKVIDRKYICF